MYWWDYDEFIMMSNCLLFAFSFLFYFFLVRYDADLYAVVNGMFILLSVPFLLFLQSLFDFSNFYTFLSLLISYYFVRWNKATICKSNNSRFQHCKSPSTILWFRRISIFSLVSCDFRPSFPFFLSSFSFYFLLFYGVPLLYFKPSAPASASASASFPFSFIFLSYSSHRSFPLPQSSESRQSSVFLPTQGLSLFSLQFSFSCWPLFH